MDKRSDGTSDMRRREFIQCAVGATALWAGPSSAVTGASWSVSAANQELFRHRIAKLESRPVEDRFPRTLGPNAKSWGGGCGAVNGVRIITTDRGVVGWSLGARHRIDPAPWIGRRVGDLFDVSKGVAEDVPFWLDKTLHDLAGAILGIPVWKMLGAHGSRNVPLYSSSIYMQDLIPKSKPRGIPAVVAACREDARSGYRAFKLKIGRGAKWMPRREGLARDIAVTRAVREALPECRILVDANDAYTVDEAIEYIHATADCHLYWFEEPFEENLEDYRRLREAMEKHGCKTLIADGESRREHAGEHPTRFGGYTNRFVDRLLQLAEEKLVDVLVMDQDIVGYSRWRHVMPELKRIGVQVSPHTWVWRLRTYFAAHLAAGLGNIPIVEGIPGETTSVDFANYRFEQGKLRLPDKPGFGLALRH